MHSPLLSILLAQARVDELRRSGAGRRRQPRSRSGARTPALESSVTLRFGFPDDARALARLAALDSAEPPRQPVLLAEVGSELRAAISLVDGEVLADPFYRSEALVELLRARAGQLEDEADGLRRRQRRAWARFGLPVWR